MSPLSGDPDARAAQLANLTPGAGEAGAQPGNARRVTHGLRSSSPMRLLDTEVIAEMRAAIVEAIPVRDAAGEVAAGDVLAAEALAVQGAQVLHAARWFAQHPDDIAGLDLWSRMTERYARGLERLGIGPAARARLGVDLAQGQSLAQRMAELHRDRESRGAEGVVDGG